MFVVGNLIGSLAYVINIGLTVLYWMILIRVLVSWVNPDPFNSIVQFLYRMTDSILDPIRQRLPDMPLDISPIIAVVGIIFLQRFLVQTLLDLAWRLRYS